MNTPNELARAKLKVMAQVPYVQKRKTPGLNYSFAGEAAIIEKLHPAMEAAGLAFAPTGCTILFQEAYTTKNGAAMNRVIVQATYTLTHADSGQSEALQTLGEGSDSGDKATSKALTSALKYALRQAFLIETGDDPDETPSVQQERAPAAPHPRHATDPVAAPAPTIDTIFAQITTLAALRRCEVNAVLPQFLATFDSSFLMLDDLPASSWPKAAAMLDRAIAKAKADGPPQTPPR